MTLTTTRRLAGRTWEVDHAVQHLSRSMATRLGITGPQRLVLRVLGKRPRIAAGELASLLHLDASTMTGHIRKLEELGLLERWPELAPRLHFIQLAVPTRENVDVNGKFGTATGVPIHFMHRELEFDELVALYGAADVMIVTPLRDAARAEGRGALVLSEFAGAADELNGALLVNPYDIEEVARRLHKAIVMPVAEQTVRMTALRRHVREHDVSRR